MSSLRRRQNPHTASDNNEAVAKGDSSVYFIDADTCRIAPHE
ncbi:hypothetical protein VIN30_00745 [Adlercreutzia sp. R7]|uniref:Uncharacterized protein n=1 Tax=Adlercreutzia wanghongyangiae TaxID=3111451 RepID=A0ABU6IEX3_9ACTN|nr:hypothetical protein [Adlercreutzia sp. R7]